MTHVGLLLARVLARRSRLADLVPELHQHALAVVGGVCSVVLQRDPRSATLLSTSALPADGLTRDAWFAAEAEAVLAQELSASADPIVVPDAIDVFASLRGRWPTCGAVFVPLRSGGEPEGLLVVGTSHAPGPDQLESLARVGDAFAITLERMRYQRDRQLDADLRHLLDEFSRAVTAELDLAAGLARVCAGATRLFAATRASIWLHERRMHRLVLAASSDPKLAACTAPVPTTDVDAPAVVALRRERAECHLTAAPPEGPAAPAVTVGLRGRRRALGTLMLDGVTIVPGGDLDLRARVEEAARQLSAALENTQLFVEVLRSRRQLENTFNSLADLVAVCDADLHIVRANRAFAERIGRPVDAISDLPIAEFLAAPTMAWLRQAARERPTGPATGELQDAVLDGTFLVTVTPLADDHHHVAGSVVVARDISQQAQLEAERAQLRDRLTQSEKLAALGQFVAGIAHELNNPLQGALGHLELLRRTGAFPREVRRDVQLVYREADRAAKIVRNLLIFAGSPRLARRRLSVNLLVSRVLALRGSALRGAGIAVVRALADDIPRLPGDPLLLQQALLNVVLNAEQAMTGAGRPGRLTVRTAYAAARRLVTIEVEDTGGGIRAESLPRIFEPFYTTKDVGKGTGLGLAVAYGIMQEHGGGIRAANGERGAVFTLELPVAGAPTDALE